MIIKLINQILKKGKEKKVISDKNNCRSAL